MRLYEMLIHKPLVFDPRTKGFTFDVLDLFAGDTMLFVADDIAEKAIVETKTNKDDPFLNTTAFSEDFQRLINPGMIHHSLLTACVPPYDHFFVEFRDHWTEDTPYQGVYVETFSPEQLERVELERQQHETYKDLAPIKFAMHLWVFRQETTPISALLVDTEATLCCDDEGHPLILHSHTRSRPEDIARIPSLGVPASTGVFIVLLSMMFLNTRLAHSTEVQSAPKTRQQRRYEERHPDRAQQQVSYNLLTVDQSVVDRAPGDGTHKGGWTVSWHRVRGHLRHLKSGKVVPVKPHHRGNALKGVVLKDYEVKTPVLG